MSEQQSSPGMKSLLTVRELASFLHCSPSNVYATVASGELQAYRVGAGKGGLRFNAEQIDAYLKSRKTEAKGAAEATKAPPPPTPPLTRLSLS